MPSTLPVRERLIRLLKDNGPSPRRVLVRAFSRKRRAMADEEIGKMLNENIFAITGRGVKGSPVHVVLSAGYDSDRCRLCGQLVAHR
jgi:hypothetical protein